MLEELQVALKSKEMESLSEESNRDQKRRPFHFMLKFTNQKLNWYIHSLRVLQVKISN